MLKVLRLPVPDCSVLNLVIALDCSMKTFWSWSYLLFAVESAERGNFPLERE